MLYKSCDYVEHGLYFGINSILHCCHLAGRDFDSEKIINDYHGEKIDWNYIKEVKKQKREMHKQGIFSPCCKDCIYLKEQDWDEEDYINIIFLSHFTKCNSNCIYCFTSKDKKYFNKLSSYNVFPILEDMQKNGYLKFDGTVFITGREPTELKDFDKIIDFFEKNNQNHFYIQTNGIKYSKLIEKILLKGCGEVNISIDSGCKDTYKKIKGVNEFNKVSDNIKKYNASAKGESIFVSKYILIPSLNDNKKEIDSWFDECLKNGLKTIAIDMESSFLQTNPKKIPEIIPKLIDYIKQRGYETGINVQLYSNADQLLYNLKNGICETIEENPVTKEYLSCEDFLHTICFFPEGIKHCMYMAQDNAQIIPVNKEQGLNIDYIFEEKHKIEEQRINGKIEPSCKNCFKACKSVHDNRNYISKILISHRKDCNAECVFCYNQFDENLTTEPYSILPQLEQFKPYFANGCEMHFGGGEPTIWEEFEDIIDFALKENFTKIFIATNGVKFSQKLADAIAKGKASVVVTTDIADEALFQNLKGINFKEVTETLKKYVQYDVSGNAVQNKYIIIPNINDSEKMIAQWVAFNKNIGVKNLAIDIEAIFFNNNRNNISRRLKNLVNYAENLIKKQGMNCILYNFAAQMRFDNK